MSKRKNPQIVIYRRNWYGRLVKVAAFNRNEFDAVISTNGAIRINRLHSVRGEGVVAAYAQGEWSVVTSFSADYFNRG